jgi:type I restriction enzyme, S subunit
MGEDELPAGWGAARLCDICDRITDGSHNPPKKQQSGLPMLSAVNIAGRAIHFDQYRHIQPDDFEREYKRTGVEAGDVLVTIVGTIGRTAVVPKGCQRFTLQRSVAVLKPAEVDARFLMYQIESAGPQSYLRDNAKGTAQKGIYLRSLSEMPILLAPLPEQQRIVEKIETLFAEIDKGEEALREAQKLLARYRQSVLKAAVTGELTADWRASNGPQRESGRDLLARIRKQRRATWQGRGKYKEPVEPVTEGLPGLPEGWVWTSLDCLADHHPNAIVDGPFGSKLKTSHYQKSGVRVIRLENIGDGEFRDKRSFISEVHADELERHSIFPDDLAIASLGSELPRACIIPKYVGRAVVKADCIRFSPHRECVDGKFVLTWLNSWLLRHRVGTAIRGVGRPRLNLKDIRAFPVPLPSFDEQREISERVVASEVRISQLISWTRREEKRSGALRQSILKDAFSGKLVPQDPSDEPVERLLDRIRAARSETMKPTRRKVAA